MTETESRSCRSAGGGVRVASRGRFLPARLDPGIEAAAIHTSDTSDFFAFRQRIEAMIRLMMKLMMQMVVKIVMKIVT